MDCGFARGLRGSPTLAGQEIVPDAGCLPARPCTGVRRRDMPPVCHENPGSPHGELARILRAGSASARRIRGAPLAHIQRAVRAKPAIKSRLGRGHGWPTTKRQCAVACRRLDRQDCRSERRRRPRASARGELHGCSELHRSAKREQGAHVRAQGRATKPAGTAGLNAAGGPERQRRASHRDVASSSRRPAWREKHRAVSATRR
jgi:hypothetical protein